MYRKIRLEKTIPEAFASCTKSAVESRIWPTLPAALVLEAERMVCTESTITSTGAALVLDICAIVCTAEVCK
jgi:hypothetical protein